MKNFIKNLIHNFLVGFTLVKLISALVAIIAVAGAKYLISGAFYIEYSEFFQNVGVGLLGFTVNTGIYGLLSEYFNIKGINFNLKQFLFGFHTMNVGDDYSKDFKLKLYNPMESDKELNKPLNEGKDKNSDCLTGGGIDGSIDREVESSKDLYSQFTRKRINPGPGFNVPGGVVPIRDEICKHIQYNSHILKQFRTMDLETAIEQRNAYLNYVHVLTQRTLYAQGVLSNVPEVPTTQYEFKLRNQILKDLDKMNTERIQAEAKATLIKSRIEFIEIQINTNK